MKDSPAVTLVSGSGRNPKQSAVREFSVRDSTSRHQANGRCWNSPTHMQPWHSQRPSATRAWICAKISGCCSLIHCSCCGWLIPNLPAQHPRLESLGQRSAAVERWSCGLLTCSPGSAPCWRGRWRRCGRSCASSRGSATATVATNRLSDEDWTRGDRQ